VHAVLGAERGEAFCAAYGVSAAGNFEHGTTQLVDAARRPRALFAAEREALREARSARVPPGTDRKRVASWNGWTIAGLARAGALLGDEAMLRDAAAGADFVLARMRDPQGRLFHVYDEGRPRVLGFLEDSASLLEAVLELQRAGAGERFLAAASALAEDLVSRFWDEAEGELFLTPSDGEPLVHRPRAEPDGATPHAAGAAALALLRAAALAGRAEWARVAEHALRAQAFAMERMPEAYPTLARAAALAERGVAVAVIVGSAAHPATRALAERARRMLAPEDGVVAVEPGAAAPPGLDPSWIAGREASGGRPTAYLCRGASCSLPVTEPDELAALGAIP
jgi:uncharacterized protein YyaL (SSP411 family)